MASFYATSVYFRKTTFGVFTSFAVGYSFESTSIVLGRKISFRIIINFFAETDRVLRARERTRQNGSRNAAKIRSTAVWKFRMILRALEKFRNFRFSESFPQKQSTVLACFRTCWAKSSEQLYDRKTTRTEKKPPIVVKPTRSSPRSEFNIFCEQTGRVSCLPRRENHPVNGARRVFMSESVSTRSTDRHCRRYGIFTSVVYLPTGRGDLQDF